MSLERLNFALAQGGLDVPLDSPVVLFGATPDAVPSVTPAAVVQRNRAVVEDWALRGVACVQDIPEGAGLIVLTLPRARDLAKAMIAEACTQAPGAVVAVNGAKTDGVDSVLRAVKARVPVSGQVSKAHGKVFWFNSAPGFEDWAAADHLLPEGFVTRPGVFSADGIDSASRALAEVLPVKLGAQVADFGAGWGYLARHICETTSVEALHLVEADLVALDCARRNVTDPRAVFHWADATRWETSAFLDTAVMNPPFHSSRASDPALGQAFIQAAARCLKPNGHLWLVANRHLPYESTLEATFRRVEQVATPKGFKIFHASQPSRVRR